MMEDVEIDMPQMHMNAYHELFDFMVFSVVG